MTNVGDLPTVDAVRATPAPHEGKKQKLNIVLFSGGSGAHSITEALLRHPQISLSIVINAYDDGHSTGRLRRFIPGMLGPSDVRKNVNRLMPRSERCHKALRALSDFRLKVDIPEAEAVEVVAAFADRDQAALSVQLQSWYSQLTIRQADALSGYCSAFREYWAQSGKIGRAFNFTDCAIGNIFFAGCYLQCDQDFNTTVREFCRFYEVESTVLNVTDGENLFLIASKEDGSVLLSEEAIVSLQSAAMIDRIMLVEQTVYFEQIEKQGEPISDELRQRIGESARYPQINPEADAAIRAADVIIYGPGTQHSSLFPSYLTRGVGEALVANATADKVFVANIRRDFDIQKDDAGDLAQKLLTALGREGQLTLKWDDVVSHFFFQEGAPDTRGKESASYVTFDRNRFSFPLEKVKLRDWEFLEGKHAGGYVVEELQAIVQSRMGIALQANRHLISIVVPALNEAATVSETLTHLMALDFSANGLSKEIIFVDGGSTDGTIELAKKVRGVRTYQLEKGFGRGAAIRLGIEKARGDLIVCYPADNEYQTTDIFALIGPIMRNEFKVVFGARTIKCFDLTGRLKGVYGRWGFTYLASKYGGMLLSVLTLLLYNRYVTDTLTSMKAFDARLLRGMNLHSSGVDLDMEVIAKLWREKEFILEIPVDFQARTRAQGKKMGMKDGIDAAVALIRYRFF